MTRPAAPRRGFTLLELMVVVGIIALLAAIVLGISPSLLGGQKKTLTKATLHALDGMLDEYMRAQGGTLPAFNVADYAGIPGEDLIAGGDGKLKTVNAATGEAFAEYPAQNDPAYPRFPDSAAFIRVARGSSASADKILADLPVSHVRPTIMPDKPGAGFPADETDTSPSIVDSWTSKEEWSPPFILFDAKPILFVHPRNLLAQALYGKCLNGRAYFMSAGPDRNYGDTLEFANDPDRVEKAIAALKDNVYSYPVGPADIDPGSTFNRNKR